MVDSEDDIDPKEALKKLQKTGFAEGQLVTDVRAKRCQIATLTATTVILVPEGGQPLDAGDAADLWDFYQQGSISLVEDP